MTDNVVNIRDVTSFVQLFINMKASDECKALTSFRTDNIPKWFKALHLSDCIVTEPLRLSFKNHTDYTLSFNGMEETKAKRVLGNICDYLNNEKDDDHDYHDEHNQHNQQNRQTIILPLSFGSGMTYHTNVILINPVRKEFERFEPYGQYRLKTEIQSDAVLFKLDTAMNSFLSEKLYTYCPNLLSYSYVTTADFCPRVKAPQHVQEEPVFAKVRKNELIEFVGFCTVWSMMYAHLRILFPEMSGQQVLTELNDSVKKNTLFRLTWDTSTAMTKLVQRYACFLSSL